jgi:hypothetical protein
MGKDAHHQNCKLLDILPWSDNLKLLQKFPKDRNPKFDPWMWSALPWAMKSPEMQMEIQSEFRTVSRMEIQSEFRKASRMEIQ